MKKTSICLFVFLYVFLFKLPAVAENDRKEETDKYGKLFLNGQCVTAAGDFVTLHLKKGNVYMEYPLKYLGRELLLASTTSSSTNGLICTNGFKERPPMHIRFVRKGGSLVMQQVNPGVEPRDGAGCDGGIKKAGFADPNLARYEILTFNPDSTAAVVDVSDLFLNGEKKLSPLPEKTGEYKVQGSFRKDLSSILEVKSFEDNASVRSRLVYRYGLTNANNAKTVSDQPLEITVTRSMLLLPEEKMRPRLSDRRLGTFLTSIKDLTTDGRLETYTVANRWNIRPADTAAFMAGRTVGVVEPIVFYLDSLFPPSWKQPIREGICRWNRAFEKIGLKDVIQVRDFPDPLQGFDPDNLKFSCVRYVPRNTRNAMGPSWVDPSSGEILNAGIFIYNDLPELIRNWRYVQTAQLDTSVRQGVLPEELLYESLSYITAHEMGHCLGLMHNMAASHAYPTDSLRSPSFTRQYGTTPSIMDYARFNYIAQPKDLGVGLTPPELGVYDEFMIAWLYTPVYPSVSFQEESGIMEAMVDAKAGDPYFRYGRQQLRERYDPTAIEEDLGDDALRSGDYGISNLKYILAHLEDWVRDDADYGVRNSLYDQIRLQYFRYVSNVIYNIGGIRLDDAKEEAGIPRVSPVPAGRQQASLAWVMARFHDMEWLDNPSLMKKTAPLGRPSLELVQLLGKSLFKARYKVALSSLLDGTGYTQQQFADDVFDEVWEKMMYPGKLKPEFMVLQKLFLEQMEEQVTGLGGNKLWLSGDDAGRLFGQIYSPDESEILAYGLENGCGIGEALSGTGYGWQKTVNTAMVDDSPALFLGQLERLENLLSERLDRFSGQEKDYYEAVLFSVRQMLGIKL